MPGDIDRNQIDGEGRGRSMRRGDVPEPLRSRYYLDEKGGPGLGFYVDARVQTAAFRDLGARLVSGRSDPNAIRDMAAVAHHRGWTVVVVHGETDFRREAWLTATALGMEVRGYRPTERDLQELERREAAHARKARTSDAAKSLTTAVRNNIRVVETVVRARVAEAGVQERILTRARERIAGWLERGAWLDPVNVGPPPRADRTSDRSRERQGGR